MGGTALAPGKTPDSPTVSSASMAAPDELNKSLSLDGLILLASPAPLSHVTAPAARVGTASIWWGLWIPQALNWHIDQLALGKKREQIDHGEHSVLKPRSSAGERYRCKLSAPHDPRTWRSESLYWTADPGRAAQHPLQSSSCSCTAHSPRT